MIARVVAWVREEATARNIRLGLAPDHGLISDDDRR